MALLNFKWVTGITAHRASARSLSGHLALRGRLVNAALPARCTVPVKVAQRIVMLDALANSSHWCRCRTKVASQYNDVFSARADRTSSLPQCLLEPREKAGAESVVRGNP